MTTDHQEPAQIQESAETQGLSAVFEYSPARLPVQEEAPRELKCKMVWQLDSDMILIGTTIADESPMEPGVFMIPGGCVDVEPPACPATHRARWTHAGWDIEERPVPVAVPVITTAPAERMAFHAVVKAFMDATAFANGYDDLMTVISYAEEDAVPAFQAEGKAFRAWRSLVWAAVFDLKTEPAGVVAVRDALEALPELEGDHYTVDLDEWGLLNTPEASV